MADNDPSSVNITKHMDDIQTFLMTLAQENTYQDVVLVCKDEVIWSVRVLLALAYPLMAEVLKERSEQKELVVFLPDFKSQEVKARVEEILTSGIKEDNETEEQNDDMMKLSNVPDDEPSLNVRNSSLECGKGSLYKKGIQLLFLTKQVLWNVHILLLKMS